MLMQPKYAHVRNLHLQAGDAACYWLALCQFEQNRLKAVLGQCRMYSDQHSSGLWVAANQALLATALAKQNRLKDAIRAIKEIDEDHPAAGGYQLLMARWLRLLEAAK